MHLLRSLASYYCRVHNRLPRPSSSSSSSSPSSSSSSHIHGPAASRFLGIRAFNHSRWDSANSASEIDRAQRTGAETNTGRWALGSMLTLMFPFFADKWKTLSKLQGEMEIAAEVVETAVEVVEEVAVAAEKVSSEVAERLPEDGKLKAAALLVERASKAAAKQAHLASEIIDEVDKLKEEVEMLIEPIMGPENNVQKSK